MKHRSGQIKCFQFHLIRVSGQHSLFKTGAVQQQTTTFLPDGLSRCFFENPNLLPQIVLKIAYFRTLSHVEGIFIRVLGFKKLQFRHA